jgi:uncharacterized repeat protein (TIGR03803 family)
MEPPAVLPVAAPSLKTTSGGIFTSLYTFNNTSTSGANPYAGLVLGTDGNFYGTTEEGGTGCSAHGCGTIFKISPSGALTTLVVLSYGVPFDSLMQTNNGNFYGTATGGRYEGYIFELTLGGTFTVLYDFPTGGHHPYSSLVQGTDGNLYGTVTGSPAGGLSGTVFEITLTGSLTDLFSFDRTDGITPFAGLMQSTNGTFYGMTYSGGANDLGTIYSISTGLRSICLSSSYGGLGRQESHHLVNKPDGATAVRFNGTAAIFTASGSAISTTVPAGATTGTVTVTTRSGTLSSNVVFTVTP